MHLLFFALSLLVMLSQGYYGLLSCFNSNFIAVEGRNLHFCAFQRPIYFSFADA